MSCPCQESNDLPRLQLVTVPTEPSRLLSIPIIKAKNKKLFKNYILTLNSVACNANSLFENCKGRKGKVVPVPNPLSHEDVWRSGYIDPRILNLSTTCRCVVSFGRFTPGERVSDKYWIRVWMGPRAGEKSLPVPGIEPKLLGLAHS
jgi:hypothetical protein